MSNAIEWTNELMGTYLGMLTILVGDDDYDERISYLVLCCGDDNCIVLVI